MKRKAIIFGIKGIQLTSSERTLLKKHKPWGVILFSRNIINLKQLKLLINEIKLIFNDVKYPILIDQEGGTVSRLNKIIDLSIFSQTFFSNLYSKNKSKFNIFYKIYINSVCSVLNDLGININTVPVLDIKRKRSHNIIGNRSFSHNKNIISKLGKVCINLYKKNKIGTVIKHIPGHGLSNVDSHFSLPIVVRSKKFLLNNDFKIFKDMNSFFAMTAHIVYEEFDPIYTATHSRIIINEIIRKYIGFRGILISDDICMKALKFDLINNATKALDAGCNLILHCNGNIKEMNQLVKLIPEVDIFTQKKTSQFYKFLG